MKVGVLTYHASVSYGAFLQCYALTSFLRQLGHDVLIIDYQPPYRASVAKPWSRRMCGLHPSNAFQLLRRWQFARAINKHLALTDETYYDLDSLRRNPPQMDAYVCGSDQIWNPRHTGGSFDPAYFAAFGAPESRRIAYAASFGTQQLDEQFHASFRDNIVRLDHISVREPSGAQIVQHVTGREAAWVLDPSLLLSDYSALIPGSHRTSQYILVYRLQISPLIDQVAERVARVLGLPLVYIANSVAFWRHPGKAVYADPCKWLWLFKHASAVVTNSFHGTAFAVLFQKPFISAGLTGAPSSKSTRISEFLEAVGLASHYVPDGSQVEPCVGLLNCVDWDHVRASLHSYREGSIDFLAKALR